MQRIFAKIVQQTKGHETRAGLNVHVIDTEKQTVEHITTVHGSQYANIENFSFDPATRKLCFTVHGAIIEEQTNEITAETFRLMQKLQNWKNLRDGLLANSAATLEWCQRHGIVTA